MVHGPLALRELCIGDFQVHFAKHTNKGNTHRHPGVAEGGSPPKHVQAQHPAPGLQPIGSCFRARLGNLQTERARTCLVVETGV